MIETLVGFETLFQLICPEAREKWRKVALRCYARILIDYQKLFLFITPGRPIGQARSVWVTCLCEVGPIGLQQVRRRRILSGSSASKTMHLTRSISSSGETVAISHCAYHP